jgi:plasmid stabilization system protein ParE
MEERIPCKSVEVSDIFKVHRRDIYDYTLDVFGNFQAERYSQKVEKVLFSLHTFHAAYPECRHIATKSHIYRNIILDAHLIIDRITVERIEVLDIIHSASSIRKIRNIRNIRL